MSERVRGATSVSLEFRLTDVTTGAAKTGLDVTTLTLQFARPLEAPSAATSLTLLGSQTATYTAFGAIEKDSAHSPGVYRVDTPNGAYLTGADEVTLTVTGAAIQPATRLIDLVTLDARAANPPTDWLNGNAVKADAVTKVQAGLATPTNITAGTITTLSNLPSIPAGWLTATGIAAAALNGKGDWLTTLGATAPAGWINTAAFAAGATLPVVTLVTTATNLTNAATAGDFTGTMKTSLNAATPASVGSVSNLTPLPLPTGTVSASPAPTGTTFTATGSLNATSAAYAPTAKRVRFVFWLTGANAGETSSIASYAGAGAFTLDAAPTGTITATDTFVVI